MDKYVNDIIDNGVWQNIPSPVMLLHKERNSGLKVASCNEEFYKVLGLNANDISGKLVKDLPLENIGILSDILEENFQTEIPFSFIFRTSNEAKDYTFSVKSKCFFHNPSKEKLKFLLVILFDNTEQDLTIQHYKSSLMEYNALFHTSPCMLMCTEKNADGQIIATRCNDRTARLYKKKPEEIVGRSLENILSPNSYRKALDSFEYFETNFTPLEEINYVKKFDRDMVLYTLKTPVYSQDRLISIFLFSLDITDKVQLQEENHRLLEEYNTAFKLSIESMWITTRTEDGEFVLERCNSQYILDFEVGTDPSGKRYEEIYGTGVAKEYTEKYKRIFSQGEPERYETETEINGKTKNFIIAMYPIKTNGEVVRVLCTAFDQTEKVQKAKKLEYMTTHDSLTGVYNRQYIDVFSIEHIFDVDDFIFVATFDINGLKMTNDTFGYATGDKVLIKVAEIVKEKFKDCLCSRWGSDEFAVIGINYTAEEVSRKVRDFQNEVNILTIEECPVSVSFGYAFSKGENVDLVKLIRRAEENMNNQKYLVVNTHRYKYLETLKNMLFEKNYESNEHVTRMQSIAIRFAKYINLDENEVNSLVLSAVLHDIGKVGVSQEILSKNTGLTQEEFEEVKKHTLIGYKICISSNLPEEIALCVRQHHERYDGRGYPDGISGENISKNARIIALIDSFEVMVRGRSYQDAVVVKDALKEIERCSGTQFDPVLARQFINMIKEENGIIDL